MAKITCTMKLHLKNIEAAESEFCETTVRYSEACDYISQYVFDNEFPLNYVKLHEALYYEVRDQFGLKSQMAISAFRTVVARYKTVKEQLYKHPYTYKDKNDKTCYITKTLEWLQKPVKFSRPQIDLVRNRDYSFTKDGKLSINTLTDRVKVDYDLPDYFKQYTDGTWKAGTGKLVQLKGEWYLHIPMTKTIQDTFNLSSLSHLSGIDRGLRFLLTEYDETRRTTFISGKDILKKREQFKKTRAELQSKGTKSAKRALKRISGRENRYMTDVNHQLSKTLVDEYGSGTLFVLEDLTGVSFSELNLSNRSSDGRSELSSWAFYQFEQFLTYKAEKIGSKVISVKADYTSQRCPKCGRVHKENRNHDLHEYICDVCGYRSNDDRVGAMNIYTLGTMYVSGDANPRFGVRHKE